MNETIVRRYLESRWRRWSVIILTFGIGLLLILPAVDEYLALSARQTALSGELNEVQATAEALDQFRERAATRQAQLAVLEARAVPSEKLPVFRGKVVELAQTTSCLIRRVNVGEVRRREWHAGDNPLEETPKTETRPPSGYVLRSQPVALAVSGKLSNVRDFLNRLARLDLLVHVNQMTLQPADAAGRDTNLELDLVLFDLTQAEPPPQKPAAR